MTDQELERLLRGYLAEHAAPTPSEGRLEAILTVTSRVPQRVPLRVPFVRDAVRHPGPVAIRRRGLIAVLVTVGLVAAALLGAEAIGSHPPTPTPSSPSPTTSLPPLAAETPLHGNGPIIVSPRLGYEAVDPRSGATRPFHANGRALAWSPDGTRLASIIDSEIWITDVASGSDDATGPALRVATCCSRTGSTVLFPHDSVGWSPDGRRLVFADGGELYTVGADGSDRRQLSHLDGMGIPYQPAWSPDGQQIAFALYGPSADKDVIATVGIDGSPVTMVTGLGGPDNVLPSSPQWSRDGTRIAFLVGTVPVRVVVVGLAHHDRQVLFQVAHCCMTAWGDLAWSPDGQRIAVILLGSTPAHDWSLYVTGADGSSPVELTQHVAVGAPAWRPVP